MSITKGPELNQEYFEGLKIEMSKLVGERYNYRTEYGPFKGMKLLPQQFWGQGELANKILGIYELEVMQRIQEIKQQCNVTTLVDVGGADGFYVVGSLIADLVDRAIVFERSDLGKESILQHARLNGVESQVEILGEADTASFHQLLNDLSQDASSMLCLIDIEGFEYELLSADMLDLLSRSHLIIEIHDRFIQDKFSTEPPPQPIDFSLARDQLFQRARMTHDVDVLWESGRDLSQFEFLQGWSDFSRSLLVSECRTAMGCWWHLSPK